MEEGSIVFKCQVCGSNDFQERNKFLHCLECGAKAPVEGGSAQFSEGSDMEHTESDANDYSPLTKKRKWNINPRRLKRKKPKMKLTNEKEQQKEQIQFDNFLSYYNYILHGLVEKLIQLGAKKEIKPLTLQVWTAYLKARNIAFFNDPYSSSLEESETVESRKEDNNDKSSMESVIFEKSLQASSGCTHRNRKFTKLSGKAPSLADLNKKKNVEGVAGVDMLDIYSILAIALNYAEDEIQLSDLIRLIVDGDIRPYLIAEKFPRDIIVKLCKDTRFKITPSYMILKSNISLIGKFIGIETFANPDFNKLVSRYLTELHLPKELAILIERLIAILPPQMRTRNKATYPQYEARAMAYIVFVLKLLFGLDGMKEHLIGESAKKINEIIDQIKENNTQIPKLFIWSDWVEYIEMRKILVTKTILDMKLIQTPKLIEEVYIEDTYQDRSHNINFANMKVLLKDYLRRKNVSLNRPQVPSSLLPLTTVFDHIKSDTEKQSIPHFMNYDHDTLSVYPFLDPTPLHKYFAHHDLSLKVYEISNKADNSKYVGIFKSASYANRYQNQEVNFDISFEEWADAMEDFKFEALSFDTTTTSYRRDYSKNQSLWRKMNMKLEPEGTVTKPIPNILESDFMRLNACEVFDEDNLNPIAVKFDGPRRMLDNVEVLKNIDLSSFLTSDESESYILNISKLDIWTLLGYTSVWADICTQELEKYFSDSFLWLLSTCADCIGLDIISLYEQLLVIESLFFYGVDNLDKATDCLYIKYRNDCKQVNFLAKQYNEII